MNAEHIFELQTSMIEKPFVPQCDRPRYNEEESYRVFSLVDFTYDAALKLLEQTRETIPPTHFSPEAEYSPHSTFTFEYKSGLQIMIGEERGLHKNPHGEQSPFHKITIQQIPNIAHPSGERLEIVAKFSSHVGEDTHVANQRPTKYETHRVRRTVIGESHNISHIGEENTDLLLLKPNNAMSLLRNYLYKISDPDNQPNLFYQSHNASFVV